MPSSPTSSRTSGTTRRIVDAGYQIGVPAGAEVIDATGKWVTPGIVAGFSRLGLSEVDLGGDGTTDDSASGGPFSAAIDVAPAINPLSSTIAVNRADGVTRAIVAPSVAKNIFAGQGAVIDLGFDMDPITARRRFQFVELGENGAEEAGGSRASAHVLFRNALREASELRRFAAPVSSSGAPDEGPIGDPVVRDPNESRITGPSAQRSDDVLLTRFDAAALVPVLRGRQLLLVHVERASDILQMIALKKEFPALRLVLVGVNEGWTVADRLAARDQDRGQIDQHSPPVMDRDEPAPRQHLRDGASQADPVRQQPDRGGPGQRRHPSPIRRH